jgi:putative ABC transport system permease protein
MLGNYLSAAWRNAIRDRVHAIINVLGLSVGLAAAILIGLYVRNELNYDRFLTGHDRVFRVTTHVINPGHPSIWSASGPDHVATALALEFPEIEEVARVNRASVSLRNSDVEALERVYYADPRFLTVLGLPVVAGDAATALDAPDSVVLTRSMARKYFGTDTPIGATLEMARKDSMRVTAVIEDLPANTHLTTEILVAARAPSSTLAPDDMTPQAPGSLNSSGWTYVRLKQGDDSRTLAPRLADFVARQLPSSNPSDPDGRQILLDLEPVTAIHLSPTVHDMKNGGELVWVAAVSVVALLILTVAGINFVNLMTARGARRAIEVGIRKAMGATRAQLFVQFMGESIAFVVIAAVLAVALIELALPSFNAFLDTKLGFAYWHDPEILVGIIGLVLIVGIAAGLYPALVLSALRPNTVLKGVRGTGTGGGRLLQSLVVAQFAASIGLAIASLVILRQTDFATRESLRFDKDQVLLIQGAEACGEAFRNQVMDLPGVRASACSRAAPLDFSLASGPATLADGSKFEITQTPVDFGFFELYGLRPLAGRLFDRTRRADAVPVAADAVMRAPVVINETAVRSFGFAGPAAAIGQTVTAEISRDHTEPSEIIAVVPDFPIGSIQKKIEPTLFYVDAAQWRQLSVKLDGAHVPEDLAGIDRIWNQSVAARPIVRFFLDARIELLYQEIARQGQLFTGFAVIALVIACLGLFGLSAFTAERRTKEIGIRKALGASTTDVARLLVWQFARPVMIANLIAWPVAWFTMRHWLDGFAYRIPLSWDVFVEAGGGAVLIAVLTTGFHAVQVARSRPVTALRYE